MPADDPPVARRPRDPEGTKLRLLQAAGRRFIFHGFDRTTTREIAHDAGVNVSLINRYYGSKRGLYRAVVTNVSHLLEVDDDNPPHPDGALAGFLDSLNPDTWPDLGGHPLQLLLQNVADDDDRELRAATLTAVVHQFILRRDPVDPRDELRGELVFALFCGIVLLRATGTRGPLPTASPADLAQELEAVVRDLLGD